MSSLVWHSGAGGICNKPRKNSFFQGGNSDKARYWWDFNNFGLDLVDLSQNLPSKLSKRDDNHPAASFLESCLLWSQTFEISDLQLS